MLRYLLSGIGAPCSLQGLLFLLLLQPGLQAQMPPEGGLRCQPMVGHVTLREARIWLQTVAEAEVQLRFQAQMSEDSTGPWRLSPPQTSSADRAYCLQFVLDSLEPDTRYQIEVLLDHRVVPTAYPVTLRTPVLWQYRQAPPPLRIALGSCAFVNEAAYDRPGRPYGDRYEIFGAIARQKPDIMLWLGDNIYLREADWDSRSGIQHRYSHTRRLPELQALLATGSHYAIWDDHDFGPNNADASFARKHLTREAFAHFWANPDPQPDLGPGITTHFDRSDAEFFLLDNRYYRSANARRTGERSQLGEAQLQWLLSALKGSPATFKFVLLGGQFLNPLRRWETYAHYFPQERARILQALREEGIRGVIFLSGDRHQSELSQLQEPGQPLVVDFTVSPLTSGPVPDSAREENALRVEGTLVRQRNFGLLELSGPRSARKLTLSILDAQGQYLWQKDIEARQLYGGSSDSRD